MGEKFPLTLAVLRKRVRISQSELGGRIGKGQVDVSLWERGYSHLGEEDGDKILSILRTLDPEGDIPTTTVAKDLQKPWEDFVLDQGHQQRVARG